MAEATVQMRGIRKQFPSCLANDNVDFTAYRGEIHALLGENGAGKSTLMSILTGVLQPDAGEICINGKPVMIRTPKDALQHGIGMIYQHFKLVKPFSVAENIVLGDDHVKVINKKKLEARVKALSERYCIEIDPGALTWQLSIGEQQRVEILKVLYRNANILILDEPTAGLDPRGRDEILAQIAQLHATRGISIVLVSHSMEDIAKYVERIIVMDRGKVAFDDVPKEVFAHYRELEQMGLAAPQITYIMHALREKGMDVDVTATTVEEAKISILKAVHRSEKGQKLSN